MRLFLLALVLLVPMSGAAQQAPREIPLWENGAPGFENRKNEAPIAKDYWIANIHNPTLTVYLPPPEKATHTAVVVCPGGGHKLLVFNAEGDEPARYLASLGITTFALKYRLAREEHSPYTIEKHALQDGQRAMRYVRSHAKEFNIDPARIGMMGFSAGGEVVSMVAFGNTAGEASAPDPVDRVSARPDFLIQIYPGPLGIPDVVPPTAPPAFLLAADDDPCCSVTVVKLLTRYRDAKIPVESHIMTSGGHGFNMGNRSKLLTVHGWPQRLADWLSDNHWLDRS